MNLFQTIREDRRLAEQLRALPKVDLAPTRRATMRHEIVRTVQAQPAVSTRSASPTQGSRRFAFAIVAAVIVLFLITGTVLTAQAAAPGDALYGLNQALDQLHFTVALSSQDKADVAANIAEKRQAELEKIQQKNSVNAQVQAQAQTDANEALDRAIIAVGKVKTHSEKNRAAIQSRAAQKVQHLIELRDKHRAKKASQEDSKENLTTEPTGQGPEATSLPGQSGDSHGADDATRGPGQN